MLRRGGSRLLGAALQQVRGYAAEAALATEGQEFLRFGTPFAQQLNLAPALATLPETKVTPWGGDGPEWSGFGPSWRAAPPPLLLPPWPTCSCDCLHAHPTPRPPGSHLTICTSLRVRPHFS